jgi:GTP-binding protein
VSALTGEGLPDLMSAVVKLLASAPAPSIRVAPRVTRLRVQRTAPIKVERKPFGYQVRGERVEELMERTNLDSDSGLARFQSALDRLGVNAALEAAGIEPGDTVRIGDIEFEYQP